MAGLEEETTSAVTCNKIKEDLGKLLQKYGSVLTTQLFMDVYHTREFVLPQKEVKGLNMGGKRLESQLDTSNTPRNTLYYFLSKASKASKTKASNFAKKKKKPGQEVTKKVDVFNDNIISIKQLEYSETVEIFNLRENKLSLEAILLDEKGNMLNPEAAKETLQGLDTHLILNILQNGMLRFAIAEDRKQSIQGLRICRNLVVHSEQNPSLDKLKNIGKFLKECLTILSDESDHAKIESAVDECFAIVNHIAIIDNLRKELARNAPRNNLISRSYTLHSDGGRERMENTSNLCNWIVSCSKGKETTLKQMKVAGYVCSGRTSALLDIYMHWARPNNPLNECYKLILPLLDCRLKTKDSPQNNSENPELGTTNEELKYMIQQSLERWAPSCLRKYAIDNILDSVQYFQRANTLALIDESNGYSSISVNWNGPCVKTDLIRSELLKERESIEEEATGNSSTTNKYNEPVAQLLNLEKHEIIEEIKTWTDASNHYETLYEQFQDKRILKCPHSLAVFKRVTSLVTNNLELDFIREFVNNANNSIEAKVEGHSDKDVQKKANFIEGKKMEICRFAYESILSGKDKYEIKEVPLLTSYLIGSKQGPVFFKSLFVQEYLAALYVIKDSNVGAWRWLRIAHRYKRVFKFVVQLWYETDKFVQNENHIYNYLAVSFGLYQFNNRSNKKSNFRWDEPRKENWELSDEGFELPDDGAAFRQWLFLSHVDDACNGDPAVMNIVIKLLCEFKYWVIDWENFSDSAVKVLDRISRKVSSFVKENNGCKLELVKLSGNASKCAQLPEVAKALTLLKGLQCKIQINLYYNTKDPKYGSYADILYRLKTAAGHFMDFNMPILSYDGPLTLPSVPLVQSVSFSQLVKLRVTVYERSTLQQLLSACPPKLEYLSLNVDLTHQDGLSLPLPHQTQQYPTGSFNSTCRVRIAVRYNGSFDTLALLRCIPCIHVLRLHGIYPEKNDGSKKTANNISSLKNLGLKLNVECLFIKFVREHFFKKEHNSSPNDKQQWAQDILLSLTRFLSTASRLIINQLPHNCSDNILDLVPKLKTNLPKLRRLLIQNCFVSVQDASRMLELTSESSSNQSVKALDASEFSSLKYPLKNRLPLDDRENKTRSKPPGQELIFISVYDMLSHEELSLSKDAASSHCNTTNKFIQKAYTSDLVHFCYEGYRECSYYNKTKDNKNDDEKMISNRNEKRGLDHGSAFEVLISPTRDLRLHLHIFELNDKALVQLPNIAEDLQASMAYAQYLHIRCKGLSADGFIQLAYMVRDEKQKQLAAASNNSYGDGVNNYNCDATANYNNGVDDGVNNYNSGVVAAANCNNDVDIAVDNDAAVGSLNVVDSFHLTVISTLDESCFSGNRKYVATKQFKDQYVKEECNKLKLGLSQIDFLSYAYYELIDPHVPTLVLFEVRKTHRGNINDKIHRITN